MPFRCIFEAAAFLASNNELDACTFTLLVVEYHLENSLVRFLGLGTPGTKILGMRLMKFSAVMRQIDLIKHLWASGVSIDHVAEDLLRIDDPDFRKFTLSSLSVKSLCGEVGGRLLLAVIDVKDIASAKILIQAGADINFLDTRECTGPSSPILRAVDSGSIEMVKLIVENGARLNTRLYQPHSTYTTPLIVAVKLGHTTIARYLLDHGAAVEGQIEEEPLISYLETHMHEIYSTLVDPKAQGEISEWDILSAASNKKSLLHFLSEHFISAKMAEKAFEKTLRLKKTKEAVHMIQQGVLRECSNKALGLVLKLDTRYDISFASLALLVMLLIQEGADANIRGLLDPFLREDAWADQQPEVFISLLIDAGFNLEEHGARAVEEALSNDLEVAALFLIESGTKINSYGQCLTPFQAIAWTAWRGDTATLKDLVRQGAEINQPAHPHRGFTALQGASLGKCLKKMAYLVRIGAEVNARPAMIGGMTALEATFRPEPFSFSDILHGKESRDCSWSEDESAANAFRYLLEHGAHVNREDGSDSPLLHDIIERGEPNLLDEALILGARTDGYWGTHSSSFCARTPIQLAAERGAFKAVQLLMFHGADVNAPAANHIGRTALQAAAVSEDASTEMITFLLNHDADVNAPPAQDGGVTALQGAAIQGYINIALLLIEHGAEINAMPALCNGRTAIEGAAEHGRLDMVQLLLNAGAVGNVLGGKGFSEAIRLAGDNHRSDIVELLEAQMRR